MNYQTAKRRVFQKRITGTIIATISLMFVLAGLLIFLYNSFETNNGRFLENVSISIKRLVYGIFENTQFLLPIWNNASVPDPKNITSKATLGFFIWYMGIFVGASLLASANKLARRLRAIDEQIENEAIRDSIRGNRGQTRTELEQQTIVPNQSVWRQFHTLYVAPFLVGIILWIIAKAAS